MKKPSVYGFDSERQPYLLWLDISERENSPPFSRGSESEPLFFWRLSQREAASNTKRYKRYKQRAKRCVTHF